MGAIANFVVRGPGQAALVAATTLTMSVALPPVVWLSNAVLALYLMRFGWKGSVPMLLVSTLGALALFWAVFGLPTLGIVSGLIFWLPVLISALVLRVTVSLELATLSCLASALAAVLVSYALLGDPAVYWRDFLGSNAQLSELLVQSAPLNGVDLLGLFAKLATGLMAGGVFLNTLLGLYLGRHWQAQQFQPGGFKEAFCGLKLGLAVNTASAIVCALGLFSETGFGFALAMPLVFLLTVQGLAVVHGIAAARQWPKMVVVSVYLALLVPHVVVLICVLAIVDAWFDLRARV